MNTRASKTEYFTRMKTLNEKITKLMANRPKKTQIQYKTDAVINLSLHELSNEKKRVLARGFKFTPSRKELPIEETIVATEPLIKTAKIEPAIATKTEKYSYYRNRQNERFRKTKTDQTKYVKTGMDCSI